MRSDHIAASQNTARPTCANAVVEPPVLDMAYVHDGTLEGLFSAIFEAYERHENPLDIAAEQLVQPRLGQEVRLIETDNAHASRVAWGISRAGGIACFDTVRTACVSSDPRTGKVIFEFVKYLFDLEKQEHSFRRSQGTKHGSTAEARGKRLLNDISNPYVAPVFERVRAVEYECERMRQFVRFAHLNNGGWFAIINPRDSVVPLIMDWFAARFNDQPFAIYDEVHHLAGVYEGNSWYLVRTDSFAPPSYASEEDLMQTAWRRFYECLSIDARYNPELRRTHMPVRYWKNLTEMQTVLPRSIQNGNA